MKTKLLTTVVCGLMLLGLGCSSENETLNDNHFAGTKWKLEGIVNEQTGVMRVLEPIDCQLWPTLCQKCYTLEFDTDTTGTGMTTTNQMYFNVSTLPPFVTIMTEINEMNDDGHFFVQILSYIRNFEHQNDTLKFFYQYENANYYLLFKKLSQ